MTLVEKVTEKLKEYGIKIYKDYRIEDEEEHVFYIEEAILFVGDKKKYIGVSFQATSKPENVANMTLILNEIDDKSLDIMESFIFNQKNEYVSGEKAFDLIKKSNHLKALEEFDKQQLYIEILQNEKCFEC